MKRIVPAAVFLCLMLLCAPCLFAESMNPDTDPALSGSQVPDTAAPPANAPSYRFKAPDFETSVCFKKCHQPTSINPSKRTEQQWRMLIEKNGHDIFETIAWEYPGQKEQVLWYLIEHAGGSGNEGIGVWQ